MLFPQSRLLYVQCEGAAEYFSSALRFVAPRDDGRRRPPGAVPYSPRSRSWALASFRKGPRLSAAQLASACALVLLIDLVFLRDVLAARLPDIVAPIAVVIAAIIGHLFPPRAASWIAIAALAAGLLFAAVPVAARRTALPTPADIARQAVRVTHRLASASPEIEPNPALAPLIAYLNRCTRPRDRVLVMGFGPEIPVLAGARRVDRIPGYYDEPP